MPEISVVVPVYKVEPYLHRCVDSILCQSFRDFELILVDDGSPDTCGAICDEYALQDSRIHVIHQKNGGLSAARNTGIDWAFANSDSHWFTFVDSDDWIHPQMLETLLSVAKDNDVRVSVCGYRETEGEQIMVEPEELEDKLWEPERFYTEKFVNATVAWGKLYARECFQEIRYPNGKIHEDEFVTYRILFAQERIAAVPAPMYAYFVNRVGITKSKWKPARLDAWEAYEQQIAFFEKKNKQELVHFRYREYLEGGMRHLAAAEENAGDYPREIRFIEQRMRSVIRRAWRRGSIAFWPDYDMLYRFYPLKTRLYRPILEWKVRRQRRKEKKD